KSAISRVEAVGKRHAPGGARTRRDDGQCLLIGREDECPSPIRREVHPTAIPEELRGGAAGLPEQCLSGRPIRGKEHEATICGQCWWTAVAVVPRQRALAGRAFSEENDVDPKNVLNDERASIRGDVLKQGPSETGVDGALRPSDRQCLNLVRRSAFSSGEPHLVLRGPGEPER